MDASPVFEQLKFPFNMSFVPAPTESPRDLTSRCNECQTEFGLKAFKHECNNCHKSFCSVCLRNKCLVPQEQLDDKGNAKSWFPTNLFKSGHDAERFHRVCDGCFEELRDQQESLRLAISKANQETPAPPEGELPKMPSMIDFTLDKEIQKAAAIVQSFKHTVDGEGIPRRLLQMAKGVVFFTIVKAGLIFSGRYGTGLIVARLPEGRWSAPSAVQMSGAGWGLQIGADCTTVMLILTSDKAVDVFTSRGQVSIGAELSVSAGLMGRAIEADVAAGSEGAAHAFSYAQSKGLFVGAALEASGIAARPDVNRTFYGEDVPVKHLLHGEYPPCKGAEVLYDALNELIDIAELRASLGDTASAAGITGTSTVVVNSSLERHLKPQVGEDIAAAASASAAARADTGVGAMGVVDDSQVRGVVGPSKVAVSGPLVEESENQNPNQTI